MVRNQTRERNTANDDFTKSLIPKAESIKFMHPCTDVYAAHIHLNTYAYTQTHT